MRFMEQRNEHVRHRTRVAVQPQGLEVISHWALTFLSVRRYAIKVRRVCGKSRLCAKILECCDPSRGVLQDVWTCSRLSRKFGLVARL